eukprot:gene8439-17401_t
MNFKLLFTLTIVLIILIIISDKVDAKKKKKSHSKSKVKNKNKTRSKSETKKRPTKYNPAFNEDGIFDVPSPDDIISEYAIVFSWHTKTHTSGPTNDPRWDHSKIGSGNEFRVAVLSCKNAHPEIPIYLFTNVKHIDKDIRDMLHRVYYVDLMKESGVDVLIKKTGDTKFGFISKAQSMLTGWDWGVLPDKIVHLDVDIVFISKDERRDMYSVFEPLKTTS